MQPASEETIPIVRHDSPLGRWELAQATPRPPLDGYVSRYAGYVEAMPCTLRRRETPAAIAVLIIDIGPPIGVLEGGALVRRRGGFLGGLSDTFTVTEHDGVSHGVQVNFTPVGARRLLGLPMVELTNRCVDVVDVFGPDGPRLVAALHEARGWAARFAVVDAFLRRRLAAGRALPRWIEHVWQRIDASGGTVAIGALAEELGYSRKHVVEGVRRELGLPPKLLARIHRFDRALRALQAGGRAVETAYDAGYFDQAHLIRDFRDFAGAPPGEFLKRALPDGGGFRDR
jgi:AraC-like DNA-binding protein